MDKRATSNMLRIGVAALAVSAAVGIGLAGPGSAQDTVTCFRVSTDGGRIEVETWIGPPPCPEGFSEDTGSTTTTAPVTTSTTATPTTAPSTTATPTSAVPTTEAPATTSTTTAPESTTSIPAAEPAEAVSAEPSYTG